MSFFFLDSSALAKRYVNESGSEWIRTLVSNTSDNTFFVADITQVEVVSGTMRRRREGLITARTARALRLVIDRHMQRNYRIVGLTAIVISRAEDLLERHALRAMDSLQLAAAITSNAALIAADLSPISFVSADRRLLQAAATEGLSTDDPTLHA
jgi:predicted nucleic acid-binding protein